MQSKGNIGKPVSTTCSVTSHPAFWQSLDPKLDQIFWAFLPKPVENFPMVRDHNLCVFCSFSWLGCLVWSVLFVWSFPFPTEHDTEWLDNQLLSKTGVSSCLGEGSCSACVHKGNGFILRENTKSRMTVGNFGHRTRGTACVILCTTPVSIFCWSFCPVPGDITVLGTRKHQDLSYPVPLLSWVTLRNSDIIV